MLSAFRPFQFNPMASEQLLDPVPHYKELRENDPIHWSEAARAWFITRHADVVNGFRDPRLSAMPERSGRERLQLRRRLVPLFTAQALDRWQHVIHGLARGLVEPVRNLGRMDGVEALTRPLPALVMAELMGIPANDRARFLEWARQLADVHAPEAHRELLAYLGQAVEARLHAPGEDLLSQLIHVPEEGVRDALRQVPHAALHLMTEQAHSAEQLGNALHALLEHPAQLDRLRRERGLMRSAVEEVLRFSPAAPFVQRRVVEGFVWQGRLLCKGDTVLLGVASANRDPEVISDPERFDIGRDVYSQKHVSFGFGAHHHLSAGLVRRELETLFEVVLEQLPGLALDAERLTQSTGPRPLWRGVHTLPVRW